MSLRIAFSCLLVAVLVVAGAELQGSAVERGRSDLHFALWPGTSNEISWQLRCESATESAACHMLSQTLQQLPSRPSCLDGDSGAVAAHGQWRGEEIELHVDGCDQSSWEAALPLLLLSAPEQARSVLLFVR